ncbi:hypothetical protein PTW37_06415 [Arthrobacter agilis]|uniref:hypothetical protein n=1 Tax=Arthrobacter agilis TaxID=37921 RepID=UPI0023662863|nr:hypothetical protein [Arthrobacter agilis]WDF34527.1 hypothetical protein PTW37_06415 [Arthrobacter agilis]
MITGPRFMTLTDVGDELSTSPSQMYASVKSGHLLAIQVGGRGQWQVERMKARGVHHSHV